ncbi:MAG TPA: hypothetical protein PKA74_04880, partial [Bauldia sp.]|nr:hypothetical protein [Bauldia sp.]
MAMAETTGGKALDRVVRRQTLVTGWLLLGLAVFVAAVFGLTVTGQSTFRLSLPADAIKLPNLVVPAAPFIYVVAGILAFFGARQFMRGGGRFASLFLGIGFLLAVAAFLVWAADGKSFSLTGMLESTVVRAVPIALGGLAGVPSERVAVV